MKIKTILKFAFPVVLYFGIVGSGYYFFLIPQLNQTKPVAVIKPDKSFGWKFPIAKFPLTGTTANGTKIAYSDIRDPGGIPQGLPVRLQIPIIGVDSAIEDALITSDGRMDVPAGSVNVAWFSLGPHPGQVGSAVIGGHFGISNGVPWVFYNLDKVKVGDKVYIVDDKNDTIAFVVRAIQSFDRDADSTPVFTSEDGIAHLNLITCEGTWNQVNGNYPLRLVVFTDKISNEGSKSGANPVAAAVEKPTAAQQPTTAAKDPEAPTQMPSAEPAPSATSVPTAIPTEVIAIPANVNNSPAAPQMLIASAKNLYATPIDGSITTVLLLSILFLVFKIIRRYYV